MIEGLKDLSQDSCNQADGASEAVDGRALLSRDVHDFPITDQQLQDLVCLFIWSSALSEGADIEGCDDDLDLPIFQLEQLKKKYAEAAWQGTDATSEHRELASLAEDIGILKEELQTLMRYCSWACTLAARCSNLSTAQLSQLRTRCEVQGLQCGRASSSERMGKDSAVSDERLHNLMRFYNWRYSAAFCGCIELDDELGLPGEHLHELMQYFSWCESRAIAKARISTSSLMQKLVAPIGTLSSGSFSSKACTSFCEQRVHPGCCTAEAYSDNEKCSLFPVRLSKAIDQNDQPIDPMNISDDGDESLTAPSAHTGAAMATQLESVSIACVSSEETKRVPPCDVGRITRQHAAKSMSQTSSPHESPDQPSISTGSTSLDSFPSSLQNSSQMMELVEQINVIPDYETSTPEAHPLRNESSSLHASRLTPEPVVFSKGSPPSKLLVFSMCAEDSESELQNVLTKCETTCGHEGSDGHTVEVGSMQDSISAYKTTSLVDSATSSCIASELSTRSPWRAFSKEKDTSLSFPNLDLPRLCPTPRIMLPGHAAHLLTEDGRGPSTEGQGVTLPASGFEAEQSLKASTFGPRAHNKHPQVPLKGDIPAGCPAVRTGSESFLRALLQERVPTQHGSSASRQAPRYDDCSGHPTARPRSRRGTMQRAPPSWNPSPRALVSKADTFCGASPSPSWEDPKAGWLSWWPSILHGFECNNSCHDEAVEVLHKTSVDVDVYH